jgi:hypothetical protein
VEGGAQGYRGMAGWQQTEPCDSGSGPVEMDLAGEELVVAAHVGGGERGGGDHGGWLFESLMRCFMRRLMVSGDCLRVHVRCLLHIC